MFVHNNAHLSVVLFVIVKVAASLLVNPVRVYNGSVTSVAYILEDRYRASSNLCSVQVSSKSTKRFQGHRTDRS